MGKPKLTPCKVPWMVSPSSGVTLTHTDTDVAPDCTVIFGGSRLTEDNMLDQRRIEIVFEKCWHARVAPKYDNGDLDEEGFDCSDLGDGSEDNWERNRDLWRKTGICPDPGFYQVAYSPWINSLFECVEGEKHYVICGRDGYVELIALGYAWRESMWIDGHKGPVVCEGKSET